MNLNYSIRVMTGSCVPAWTRSIRPELSFGLGDLLVTILF